MLTPRKLHRRSQQKDKLLAALRELYADGVRIYSGRLRPAELLQRKVEGRRRPREDARLSLDESQAADHDPYNSAR